MMEKDDYVRIHCRVERPPRRDAVMLSVGDSVPRAAWVPRSCLHGADDLTLNKAKAGDKLTLRIREWKAEQCGFLGRPDDQTDDLFGEGRD